MRERLEKELEKAGISKEARARILVEVEDAKEAMNSFRTQIVYGTKGSKFRLGVMCQSLSDKEGEIDDKADLSKLPVGLEVRSVIEGSPAEAAGIEDGDLLMKANGKELRKPVDLTAVIQESGMQGKEVVVSVKRGDKDMQFSVKPMKTKDSDLAMDSVRLSLPSGGFIVDGDMAKALEGFSKSTPVENLANGNGSITIAGSAGQSGELKQELAQLRTEVAELKKMIQELLGKK